MKNICLVLLFALSAGCTAAQQAPGTMNKDRCLSCHGPFDKLVNGSLLVPADPADVNPHQYIPHSGEGKKDIIECTLCHLEPHPLPPPSGFRDENATLDGCYGCHHSYQLQKCGSCHEKN